jgi:quercetin dioxygenase-like cupin family protein
MIYSFDIDGVICDDLRGDYLKSKPRQEIIEKINQLYDQKNTIIIFTGRGSKTGIDWKEITQKQLDSWGLKYHEIYFNKPVADIFVDDKAINYLDLFFSLNFTKKTGKKFFLKHKKNWGQEIQIENGNIACKIIELNEDGFIKLHYHTKKKETLLVVDGSVTIEINNEQSILKKYETITINPGIAHFIKANEKAKIIDFCATDDEDLFYIDQK